MLLNKGGHRLTQDCLLFHEAWKLVGASGFVIWMKSAASNLLRQTSKLKPRLSIFGVSHTLWVFDSIISRKIEVPPTSTPTQVNKKQQRVTRKVWCLAAMILAILPCKTQPFQWGFPWSLCFFMLFPPPFHTVAVHEDPKNWWTVDSIPGNAACCTFVQLMSLHVWWEYCFDFNQSRCWNGAGVNKGERNVQISSNIHLVRYSLSLLLGPKQQY